MGKRLPSSVYTFIGEWEYMGKRLSSSVYTFIGEWNTWVKDCHLQFIPS